MTTPETSRGVQQAHNYHLKYADDNEFWARQQQEPMDAGCAICGASFTGSVAEGIAWAQAHRKQNHPAAKDRGQRARNKARREGNKWPR
jgi:hypothetical protein